MLQHSIPHQSYDPTYFALLPQIEDRHFWFRARNTVVAVVVGRLVAEMQNGYRVLEVGCGTGNVLRILERVCIGGTVVGLDLFADGLYYAHRRTGSPLVQGDIHRPPFGVLFDLIGLFDVLEHLPDDRLVLRDLHDMLTEGGKLLLTVPAHPYLWSYFDEASHHCRRYKQADLLQRLQETGYQVDRMTYFMATIFPLLWIGRRFTVLARRRSANSAVLADELAGRELRIMPVINEVLYLLLALESHLLARRQSLPWGTSLLAVAHKDPG